MDELNPYQTPSSVEPRKTSRARMERSFNAFTALIGWAALVTAILLLGWLILFMIVNVGAGVFSLR